MRIASPGRTEHVISASLGHPRVDILEERESIRSQKDSERPVPPAAVVQVDAHRQFPQ